MIHSLDVSAQTIWPFLAFLSQFPHCICTGVPLASYYPVILPEAAGIELKDLLGNRGAVRFSLSAIVRELYDPWK